ncbi:hypothetical protein ATB97_13600 [Elizabethkingia bruuniana]|nr:hypothetical protein AYC65_00595 [Elizabethkingia bruuniana]KGO11828.1 hypothetical protein KS04_01370 [Elizabethkingia miricola]KUY22277.1 hypothetical protein ATB97_13600 [Elizabethkingia bruuniana]OPB62488.1 hypothetical protein BAY12_11340 [Elizabethkingia bruuniana]
MENKGIDFQSGFLSLNLKEVCHHRDLLLLLINREFAAYFKKNYICDLFWKCNQGCNKWNFWNIVLFI